MKTVLSSRKHHYLIRVSIFFITLALVVEMVGCSCGGGGGVEYHLTIASTAGGSVFNPGEAGPYTYDEGEVVNLVAEAEESYRFVNWTGDVGTIADVKDATTTITMNGDYDITANFEEAITFADPNLEAAVRGAIAIPEGPIYPLDLEGLTSLSAEERGISNLTGLEYATSLTKLYLEDNQISDISPLANLTNLTLLRLDSNQISDISPLANLANLTHLDLCGNQISDISPLANLTSLTELWLMWNQISDISPLANLANLTCLQLHYNQISDISPLANLTSLTSLGLLGNQISDINPLVDNEGLGTGDSVRLTGNPLSSDSINIYIPQLEARGVIVDY